MPEDSAIVTAEKPILLASLLLFGLFTAALAMAHGIMGLTALRFLAGIGLGGAIPNVTALVAECSPGTAPRSRRHLDGHLDDGWRDGRCRHRLLDSSGIRLAVACSCGRGIHTVAGAARIVPVAAGVSEVPGGKST